MKGEDVLSLKYIILRSDKRTPRNLYYSVQTEWVHGNKSDVLYVLYTCLTHYAVENMT